MNSQRFVLPVLFICAMSAVWLVAQEKAQPRPKDAVADAQDLKNAPQQPGYLAMPTRLKCLRE
jgi:hypothetical protein